MPGRGAWSAVNGRASCPWPGTPDFEKVHVFRLQKQGDRASICAGLYLHCRSLWYTSRVVYVSRNCSDLLCMVQIAPLLAPDYSLPHSLGMKDCFRAACGA